MEGFSLTLPDVCAKKRRICISSLVRVQRLHQLEVWVPPSEQFNLDLRGRRRLPVRRVSPSFTIETKAIKGSSDFNLG